MSYKCLFTGIPALSLSGTIDTREYTRLMSDKLTSATDTITSTAVSGLSGTIMDNSIQFLYFANAIFAVIPYKV